MASIISIRRRQTRHILRTARDLVTMASKATMIGRRRRVMTRITTTSTLISVTTLPALIAEVIHTRLAHNSKERIPRKLMLICMERGAKMAEEVI